MHRILRVKHEALQLKREAKFSEKLTGIEAHHNFLRYSPIPDLLLPTGSLHFDHGTTHAPPMLRSPARWWSRKVVVPLRPPPHGSGQPVLSCPTVKGSDGISEIAGARA